MRMHVNGPNWQIVHSCELSTSCGFIVKMINSFHEDRV